MRTLNKLEKEIVNYIVKYSQPEDGLENNIIYMLERILSKRIKYNVKKKKIWVKRKYDKDSENDNTCSIIENVVPIVQTISFIEYLEKMNFVSFVEYFCENDLEDTSEVDFSNRIDYQEINDSKIKQFIFDNNRSGIFATEHLIDYQKNGYKTIEQRRHEKETKFMKLQIILATAIAVFSIIVSIILHFFRGNYCPLLK